jgi:6-phosphogluconolactonase (cycloisomerase 2 family)
MTVLIRLAVLFSAAVAAGAVFAATAAAAPGSSSRTAHTVFVLTDNPTGNQVVAYDADANGALTQAGTYPTGGLGGVLVGSVVDHTASQGALAYDASRQLLLASNPGSSTISVFHVNGDRLALTQVIPSGGSFPVSIAARNGLVYVLNALDGGSVQGFAALGTHLFQLPFSHRELGLGTTTSTPFTATPGQVSFSPDGSKLVVTTKASGNAIDVFRVGFLGLLSPRPTVNVDAGAVPFAVAFDRSGDLVVSEAGTNSVATFSLAPDGTTSLLHRVATGQAATCWVTATGSFAFASNAGSPSVSRIGVASDGTLSLLGNTTTDAGAVDSAATPDGQFLYVQAGGPGNVDGFRIGADGSLTSVGSVTVPGAAGGEGIVAL